MKSPILITGGAQRLGLAMAEALLQQGERVIITYRSEKPAVESLKQKGATAIHADFATDFGVKKFIDEIKSMTPSLRAIIHNASDWDKEKPGVELNDLFNKMMQIHANAPYQMNMAFADLLKEGGKDANGGFADIIHMTDYVQDKGSNKHVAYAASKAALHNLTLSFSALLAPNVKVNSIAPSLLMFNEWDDDEYKKKSLDKSILKNCPGPQEAVNALNFVLNSNYITGQCIHLNGGRHLR